MMYFDCIVVGGGAAGFFTAIQHKENFPNDSVIILEKSKNLLSKVRISGGGRCNVTHNCFVPKELVKNYPRGSKELLGPFFSFNPEHVMEWFENNQVMLKSETDGRIFPVTDDSMTIVNLFLLKAQKYGIQILKQTSIKTFENIDNKWIVKTLDQEFSTRKLVLATGSSNEIWEKLKEYVNIIEPVPSLFTFKCTNQKIENLSGISFPNVQIKIPETKLSQIGPLLITHKGFSGPAILKLSAWGARILHEKKYQFSIQINFANENINFSDWQHVKNNFAKKLIKNTALYQIPSRFWEKICEDSAEKRWADVKKEELEKIYNNIFHSTWEINGKDTNQEEFVTAGGIDLKEIQWKNMEFKNHSGLFAVGEILDIDGVTGGFNFQAAWTTAWLAGKSPIA